MRARRPVYYKISHSTPVSHIFKLRVSMSIGKEKIVN